MVATEVVSLDQNRFFGVPVLPSSYVPVAIICNCFPTCTVGVGGSTVIVVSVGLTKNPRQPKPAAHKKRAVNPAKRWSFRFVLSSLKTFAGRYFSTKSQAEYVKL